LLNRLDRIFTEHLVYGSRRLQAALLCEGISVGRRHPTAHAQAGTLGVTVRLKRNTSKPHPWIELNSAAPRGASFAVSTFGDDPMTHGGTLTRTAVERVTASIQ
jgi:hypothetical protein